MSDDTPQRRQQDYGLGKMMHFSPLIGSIILTLISIGGYITTISTMGDHQKNQDVLIAAINKTQNDQVFINSRLTTLQEVTSKRLDSIEDWRNGVNNVYTNRHKRGS